MFVLIAAYAFVMSCGDSDSPSDPDGSGACPPVTSKRKVVRMLGSPDFRFEPQDLTVNRGDTVIWCNESLAIHTTTSGSACTPDGLWNSGTIGTNARFAVVFDSTGVDTVGTIPYFCVPHCKNFNMVGTVTINP